MVDSFIYPRFDWFIQFLMFRRLTDWLMIESRFGGLMIIDLLTDCYTISTIFFLPMKSKSQQLHRHGEMHVFEWASVGRGTAPLWVYSVVRLHAAFCCSVSRYVQGHPFYWEPFHLSLNLPYIHTHDICLNHLLICINCLQIFPSALSFCLSLYLLCAAFKRITRFL